MPRCPACHKPAGITAVCGCTECKARPVGHRFACNACIQNHWKDK